MGAVAFEEATRRPRFWFLLVAIAAIGPVAVYANNGTVPILLVACLGVPQPSRALGDVRRLLTSPCGLALIALVGWSLVSTLWAPGGSDAAARVVKVAAIMLAGVLYIAAIGQMDVNERRAAGSAFVFAIVAIVLLVLVEVMTGGTPAVDVKAAQSSRFVYLPDLLGTAAPVMAVLIWPVIGILRVRTGRWVWPLLVGVVAAGVALALPQASSIVAFALGGVVFGIAYRSRMILTAVGVLFAVYLLSAPFISVYAVNLDTVGASGQALPTSWQHRLEIWRFTATKAMERPLFGHGFDASREIGRAANTVQLWNPDGSGRNYTEKGLPLHPHNIALQIWLEIGLVGLVIVLGGVLLTLNWIRHRTTESLSRAVAAAGFTAFFVIELLAYGVWQSWWHAAAWVMAGGVIVAVNTGRRSEYQHAGAV